MADAEGPYVEHEVTGGHSDEPGGCALVESCVEYVCASGVSVDVAETGCVK